MASWSPELPAMTSTNVEQGFATVGGTRLFYRLEGQGPPLVLCHGYTANHKMWSFQREALGAKFRLLTWDAPGMGMSDPVHGPHGVEHYALLLAGLMDHVGMDAAHLGGLSMGGMVAQAFTQHHPHRVKALMLMDTMSRRLHPLLRILFAVVHAHAWLPGDWAVGSLRGYRQRRGKIMTIPGVPTEVGEDILYHLTRHNDLRAMARAAQVLYRKGDHRHVVAGFAGPLLLLSGTSDLLFFEALFMHELNPHSRLVALEDVHHGSAVNHPHAFNQAVLAFLDEVEQGGRPTGAFLVPMHNCPPAPRPVTLDALHAYQERGLSSRPLITALRELDERLAPATS